MNRYIELCNLFPRSGNLFPRIRQSALSDCDSFSRIWKCILSDNNSFPRIRQSVLLLNSRERIAIRGNELCKSRERIAIQEIGLSNSREHITNQWELINNPWERIAQFDITIYLWLFLKTSMSLQGFWIGFMENLNVIFTLTTPTLQHFNACFYYLRRLDEVELFILS